MLSLIGWAHTQNDPWISRVCMSGLILTAKLMDNHYKFCTWHNSCAVMSCGNICGDLVATDSITAKSFFHWILITMEKLLVKRGPTLPPQTKDFIYQHHFKCCGMIIKKANIFSNLLNKILFRSHTYRHWPCRLIGCFFWSMINRNWTKSWTCKMDNQC